MKWFNNLNMFKKLILSFSLIALILVLESFISVVQMNSMGKLTKNIYQQNLLPINQINKINRLTNQYRLILFQVVGEVDPAIMVEHIKKLKAKEQEIEKLVQHKALSDNKEDLRKFSEAWKKVGENTQEIIGMAENFAKEDAFDMANRDNRKLFDQANVIISTLILKLEKNAFKSYENSEQVQSDGLMIVLIIAIAGSLFAIVFAVIITRIITIPLARLSKAVLSSEQNGDFSVRANVDTKDEIGNTATAFNQLMEVMQSAFGDVNRVMEAVAKGDLTERIDNDYGGNLQGSSINEAVDMLGRSLKRVAITSDEVKTSSSELSGSSQSLSSGTTQQAASLQEISSSMTEVDKLTKANNKNASQAKQCTGQTIETVKKGNMQMESMLSSMKEINHTSTEITKIIKIIDEIAFQTNLLALNAAVEAARAGKYGKGFAVVADEVRNLAARSGEAAKNTTALIEKSIKEVENGVKNADQTAESLNEITDGINKVSEFVDSIAQGSVEQEIGITEINHGLAQVNNVVQQNSSIAEESASASQELTAQAIQLQQMVNQFKLKDYDEHRLVNHGKPLQTERAGYHSTINKLPVSEQGKLITMGNKDP